MDDFEKDQMGPMRLVVFSFLIFFDLRDHRRWKQNDRDKSWRLACVGCFLSVQLSMNNWKTALKTTRAKYVDVQYLRWVG